MSVSFTTRSPAETRRLGERLARLLQAGDVLLLQGELGAGKTCLAQGIGRGLKVREAVKSSSFVLVNEYNGRLKVYHADLFRLEDPLEVADLALEETASDGLLLVEWPERALQEMPPEHLVVRLEIEDEGTRRISLEGRGQRYERMLQELQGQSAPAKPGPDAGT
jgi:tRNA threonylcarbamoyladenosine biosynthesis protein TsaE